jgi:hypothetical protein
MQSILKYNIVRKPLKPQKSLNGVAHCVSLQDITGNE